MNGAISQCVDSQDFGEGLSAIYGYYHIELLFQILWTPVKNRETFLREVGLFVAKYLLHGNASENQEQPSPISVLESAFEEDDHAFLESFAIIKPDCHGMVMPFKSNLIDKSPLIGSIARTLLWDDSCVETATPYSLKSSLVSHGPEGRTRD